MVKDEQVRLLMKLINKEQRLQTATAKAGKYQDGQLRSLQGHIQHWRGTAGPGQEVFFPQVYEPGVWSESDFGCMNSLGITIGGIPFDHLLYHFDFLAEGPFLRRSRGDWIRTSDLLTPSQAL